MPISVDCRMFFLLCLSPSLIIQIGEITVKSPLTIVLGLVISGSCLAEVHHVPADFPTIQLVLLIIKNCLKNFQYSFQNTLFESGPIIPHLVHRKTTLNKINNEPGIMSNFIVRKSFAEGIRNNDRNARVTFIDNIINNDYTFCMRGGGNYSLRFYETLCLGRIPIFINTDCILPFHDEINWKENCIWINEPDIKNIGKKILKFHASLTESQFINMQYNNRKLWETYFSKPGFCHQLHLRLQNHFLA